MERFKLTQFLYKDASVSLDRKYEKAQELIRSRGKSTKFLHIDFSEEDRKLSVKALSAKFGVSECTIRRRLRGE